jgi:outer membrane protein assembly factor BamB
MRRAGVLLVAVGLCLASPSASVGAQEAEEGDQGHLVVVDAATGEPRWERAPTGGEFNELLFGVPGRRVVIADQSPCMSDLPESRHSVVAFDARTGKRRWAMRGARAVAGGGSTAPVAADAEGVVVVVAGRTVRGLRATTGDEVWRVLSDGNPAPPISSDAVFTTMESTDGSTALDARDRRTGERRFRFVSTDDRADTGLVVVAADNERVVVASGWYGGDFPRSTPATTAVFVLDARTGREEGHFTGDALLDDWASAVLVGDVLVNAEGRPTRLPSDPPQGAVVARHLPDGAVRWQMTSERVSPASVTGVAWSSDPEVVIATTSQVGSLLGLDLETGSERWRKEGGNYAAADRGRVLVFALPDSPSHEVESIDAQTGDAIWTRSVPDRIGSLAVSATTYADSVALSNLCTD